MYHVLPDSKGSKSVLHFAQRFHLMTLGQVPQHSCSEPRDEKVIAGAAFPPLLQTAAKHVKVAQVLGSGPGYFKLQRGPTPTAPGQDRVLVVAFGSAPGVPNWGGLLQKVQVPFADGEGLFAFFGREMWVMGVGGGWGGCEIVMAMLHY